MRKNQGRKTASKKAPMARSGMNGGKDATKLLKEDHTKVKGIFEQMEALSDRASSKRQQLFEKVKMELEVHTKIEEEIFYPAVRGLRSKEAKELIFEANEEHSIAKMLIQQISELEPTDETYKAKCKVLMDVVLHHAKEEEKEMFSEAKSGMSSEELKELGAKLEARKEQLMSGDLGESSEMEMSDDAEEDEAEDADDADESEDDMDDDDDREVFERALT